MAPEEFSMKIQQPSLALNLNKMTQSYGPLDLAPDEIKGEFDTQLERYTAYLKANGKTLFAISTGTDHSAPDDNGQPWDGVWHEDVAFAIHSSADMHEAEEFFLLDESNYWDLDRTQSTMYVVAPTSIIE
jgi:hypothetical protein